MSRGRELRPAWRRWVLPTSICSMEGGGWEALPPSREIQQLLHCWGCGAAGVCPKAEGERGMDHCCPDNGQHVPAPSPPGARGDAEWRTSEESLWDLYGNGKQVGLACVPGYSGLPKNEAADEMARRGSELAQERVGVDLATRMAVARRGTRMSAQLTHHRLKDFYAGGLRAEEDELTREERVMLVRFRTGHHPVLRRWQAMVDESVPTDCRLCGRGEETMEHLWLECEALEVGRHTSGLGEELGELTPQTYTVAGVTQDHPETPGRCQLNNQANSNAMNNLSPTKNRFKTSEFKPKGPHPRQRSSIATAISNGNLDQISRVWAPATATCRLLLRLLLIRIFWYLVGGA